MSEGSFLAAMCALACLLSAIGVVWVETWPTI